MLKLAEGTKIINHGGQALIVTVPGREDTVIKLFKDLDNFRREQRIYSVISDYTDVVQVATKNGNAFEWKVENTVIPSSIDQAIFSSMFERGKVYGGMHLTRLRGLDFEHYSGFYWAMNPNDSPQETLDLFKSFYYALKELHEMDISHNDVKPENAVIVQDKEEKKVVVFDFGNSTQLSDMETPAFATTFEFTPWFCYPRYASTTTNYLRDFYSLFFMFTYLANPKAVLKGLPWLLTIKSKVQAIQNFSQREAKDKLFWQHKNEYVSDPAFAITLEDQKNMKEAQTTFLDETIAPGAVSSIVSGLKNFTGFASDTYKLNDTLAKFLRVLENRNNDMASDITYDLVVHQKETFEQLDAVFS